MTMNEGNLEFTFYESFEVVKFDDNEFYRKYIELYYLKLKTE